MAYRRKTREDPWWCIDVVNMRTRVCCATSKKVLIVVVQVSHDSMLACCNKLHNPLVDNDAYADSSDVSLAKYLCTHVCLFMFLQMRLRSH